MKKRPLQRTFREVKGKIENYETREHEIKAIDTEMKKLQQEAQAKYKALEELDKQAVKDPVKEKQLRQEVTKITNEYNAKANLLNAEAGLHLKGVTSADIVRLERYSIVKNLSATNGGAMKLVEKVNTRGGKMLLRIGVAGLAWRAGEDIAKHGLISKETGLDVVDMGAGFVPVAGGLYDVGMAIYGKDLNGRDMSTADRWIRGSVGIGTAVLDVFTFGVGGTAVRAAVKGTTTTVKIVKGAIQTEKAAKTGVLIYKGAKTFTHSAMFLGVCYGVGVNAYDFMVSADEGGKILTEKVKAANTENVSVPRS